MNLKKLWLWAVWLLLLEASSSMQAHTVWLEPLGGQLAVRFAEPGKPFETSPGHLDALSPPQGFVVATNKPIAAVIQKRPDHFLLETSHPGAVAGVESIFTVRGGRKPCFYARWQPSLAEAATPALTLDLVPAGQAGEVRAYFRGQPLARAAATLRAPDGQEQKLEADEEGRIHFTANQPGLWLLTIAHYRETLAGFYLGTAYKETSHNTALSWRQD
jgi:hypothetical protein